MKLLKTICKSLLVIFLTIYAFSATAKKPDVVETSLCNLVAHPKQFDKRIVKVRARMISGIHGAVLIDSHCKRGVELWIASGVQGHSDFEDLSKRVDHHGNLGTSDKTVFATFTGQFLRYPKDSLKRKKVLVLNATKVEGLNVKYDTQ